MDPVLLQVRDHHNDTDDMPDGMDPSLVQIQINDHQNDTDDIPDNMDPEYV